MNKKKKKSNHLILSKENRINRKQFKLWTLKKKCFLCLKKKNQFIKCFECEKNLFCIDCWYFNSPGTDKMKCSHPECNRFMCDVCCEKCCWCGSKLCKDHGTNCQGGRNGFIKNCDCKICPNCEKNKCISCGCNLCQCCAKKDEKEEIKCEFCLG